MSALVVPSLSNQLLDELPRAQKSNVIADCELVELNFGDVLCEPGQNISHVYFPLSCCISLLLGVNGHPRLEMGMIGNEGMLGATLLLGVKEAPLRADVQGKGTALRMSVADLLKILKTTDKFSVLLGRYLYVLGCQISQTVACLRFHEIEPRLVRWLIMIHDRMPTDDFYLTHQFLANMLGVQRSAITIAAGVLQEKKLIRYSRGNITVSDRIGLEALSCECYMANIETYSRIFPRRPDAGNVTSLIYADKKTGSRSI